MHGFPLYLSGIFLLIDVEAHAACRRMASVIRLDYTAVPIRIYMRAWNQVISTERPIFL